MRRYLVCIFLLLSAFVVHADSDTLRVGSQVLVVGDSAARVIDLLGRPSYKGHVRSSSTQQAKGKGKGRKAATTDSGAEQWQYHDGNRTVSIIMVGGKVSAIRHGGR